MKDVAYFSHDANASGDPKIKSMRLDFGLVGYGLYWMVIELLRTSEGYKIENNKTLIRALTADASIGTAIDCETVEKFIDGCINEYGLLNTDGKNIWSDSLLRRMKLKDAIAEKRQEAGKKGAQARWNNKDGNAMANAIQSDSKSIANANQTYSKKCLKESKVKESEEKEIKDKKEDPARAEPAFIDTGFKKIQETYESNIGGLMPPVVIQEIEQWLDSGIPPDVIILAITQAVKHGAFSWSYINKILIAWNRAGAKTVEAVNALIVEFERNKGSDNSARGQPKNKRADSKNKVPQMNNFEQRSYGQDFWNKINKLGMK